jgi:ribonucleoside-triphosphate reductase (formate)
VAAGRFAAIVDGIEDAALHEAVDMAHLDCASGVRPI